jgi:hypothetical protein
VLLLPPCSGHPPSSYRTAYYMGRVGSRSWSGRAPRGGVPWGRPCSLSMHQKALWAQTTHSCRYNIWRLGPHSNNIGMTNQENTPDESNTIIDLELFAQRSRCFSTKGAIHSRKKTSASEVGASGAEGFAVPRSVYEADDASASIPKTRLRITGFIAARPQWTT